MVPSPSRALLGALAALALASCTAGEPPHPNLLLIVVDTLRPDRLGCYGAERDTSPAIDALAAQSVRFEAAATTAPWTRPAVATILTGLYPSAHSVTRIARRLPDEVTTLAELCTAAGYDTAFATSNALLKAPYGYEQGFGTWMDGEARGRHHVSTGGLTDQAVDWLSAPGRGDRPWFLGLLYFDPHYRYVPHEEVDFAAPSAGRLRGAESIQELRDMDLAPEEIAFVRDLYDEEIRHTDAGIGRLLAALEGLDLDRDTWIVLTSDHGEEFLDHGWLGHTRNLYEGLLRVPLLIRPPGGVSDSPGGCVVRQPVSLVSLTPTLVDLLGLPLPEDGFQGPSLRALIEGGASPDAAPPVFGEVDFVPGKAVHEDKRARMRSVRRGDWKLIRDDDRGTVELYDLAADPGERADLAAERPELAAELLDLLERMSAAVRSRAAGSSEARLEEADLELLQGLGYVDR